MCPLQVLWDKLLNHVPLLVLTPLQLYVAMTVGFTECLVVCTCFQDATSIMPTTSGCFRRFFGNPFLNFSFDVFLRINQRLIGWVVMILVGGFFVVNKNSVTGLFGASMCILRATATEVQPKPRVKLALDRYKRMPSLIAI